MPSPKAGYWLDGQRVPAVTTVISQWGENKRALTYAYWREGLRGVAEFDQCFKAAASIGTIAHAWVEDWCHGRDVDTFQAPTPEATPELLRLAGSSFTGFLAWAAQSRITVVGTELAVIHPQLRYGGTLDAIALDAEGRLTLLDWKTSNGTYPDHLVQLAAYVQAWEAMTGWVLSGGVHLCRFGKDTGGFTHHWWPEETLDEAWRVFQHLRALYDLAPRLRKLAA